MSLTPMPAATLTNGEDWRPTSRAQRVPGILLAGLASGGMLEHFSVLLNGPEHQGFSVPQLAAWWGVLGMVSFAMGVGATEAKLEPNCGGKSRLQRVASGVGLAGIHLGAFAGVFGLSAVMLLMKSPLFMPLAIGWLALAPWVAALAYAEFALTESEGVSAYLRGVEWAMAAPLVVVPRVFWQNFVLTRPTERALRVTQVYKNIAGGLVLQTVSLGGAVIASINVLGPNSVGVGCGIAFAAWTFQLLVGRVVRSLAGLEARAV